MFRIFGEIYSFIIDLFTSRALIYELTKKEFKAKYLGSYLGTVWALAQPLATILMFWFLFDVGFRTKPVGNGFPFILWLMAGMIPWFFINDSILTGAGAILENSFLIKKVSFRISVLPLVRILSVLFIHLFFLVVLLFMFVLYHCPLTVHVIQILYYLTASIILVSGISMITSTVTIFIKDVRHLVAIVMQFGFWMTAIFWSINILPEKYRLLVRLNPFYYIVEGFRKSLVDHQWFWESHLNQTFYFWGFTLTVLFVGIALFKRLRPYFADYI